MVPLAKRLKHRVLTHKAHVEIKTQIRWAYGGKTYRQWVTHLTSINMLNGNVEMWKVNNWASRARTTRVIQPSNWNPANDTQFIHNLSIKTSIRDDFQIYRSMPSLYRDVQCWRPASVGWATRTGAEQVHRLQARNLQVQNPKNVSLSMLFTMGWYSLSAQLNCLYILISCYGLFMCIPELQ